ncbi:MAG: Holliday junction resolvase [Nanoarchaeota archaeon]|nr:Holliday junction resolvase [Nanoarchaeota archaeon]MBU1270512.1 Holliday junction resolvase [Nanoarchaeota archaeon]MBU1604092.1 Holliday junction resolvase [Nanoarchaeota archaeon]MBU2443025.1 Holliday junction resolvase [Nanoarchaeota archaeon]
MGISHSRRKSKGSAAERDLIHKFWAVGWAAVRVAGSGSTQFPSPDILVGSINRKLALEVKATKDKKKYFPKEEISALEFFAGKFGAEAWIAIKFDREKFYFIKTTDLEETPSSFVTSIDLCRSKGLLFESLTS